MEDFLERHVAIIRLDDFGLRLKCPHNLPHALQFLRFHLGCLVEQDDIAELYLLDDEVLDVLFFNVVAHQKVAAAKLVAHAERIDDADDAVYHRLAVVDVFESHARHRTDGLGNGCRFADAAGFYDDVVEAVLAGDVAQLLHEIHLQRATDAAVLQGHKTVILLSYYATLFYQVGINVHLTDIIDNHRKLNAAAIVQDTVEECGLAAAQVAREQQHRDFFHFYMFFITQLFPSASSWQT